MTAIALFLSFCAPLHYHGVPGVPMSYEPLVSYWCNAYGVQKNLGYRIMLAESGGDPAAIGSEWVKKKGRWVRGKTLARGLFMISVKAEAEHMRNAGMKTFDPWNPSDSCRVGIAYLKDLLVYFHGDVRPAVAGYNGGREAASRWWYDGASLPYETRDYLKGVMR